MTLGLCVICDVMSVFMCFFFFFKQKTAYEMRISDWSSDVCSSDLAEPFFVAKFVNGVPANRARDLAVQDGVVILSNAETGAIEAILHDRGELTELRTALAGVAAARLIAKPDSRILGVVGPRAQARRQDRERVVAGKRGSVRVD